MFLSKGVVGLVLLFRHSGLGKEQGWEGPREETSWQPVIKRNHQYPEQ